MNDTDLIVRGIIEAFDSLQKESLMSWIGEFPVGLEFRENQRPGDTDESFAHSLGDVWVYGLEPGNDCRIYAEMVVTGIDGRWVYVTVIKHHHTATAPELAHENGWLQGSLN